MNRDTDIGGPGGGRFPATRHSAVLAAQSGDLVERERGLALLVETYWRPTYKYLRIRFGESNEDAKDLTQGFFTRALEKDFFDGYDPEKGSFRTYLRTCLDRFVANEKKAAGRAKRSPGAPLIPLDFDAAEGELALQEPPDPASLEQYFHAEWVRNLFALSVEKLREECMLRGKDLPYRLFERYELERDPDEKLTYERLAEEFQIPATQVTNFLAFARREFRRVVLEKLREITATDHEFREEAKSLLGVSGMKWLSDRTVEHLKRVAEWPDLGETKYRLLEELGRGGMGTVFLAEDRVLGRRVALKVVGTGASDPAAAARMLREARVIARLEHPGIVPVHDAGTLPDGRMFYAMKRVDGRRLDEIARDSALPEKLRTFQKVCEAVAFAHAHGVLHRDLKPENVMVGPFGEVLVMDWGVARVTERASESASAPPREGPPDATADGTIVGTPAYMSPEQAAGHSDAVGPAADVYALGGLLYFLVTGRPPFDDESARRRGRGDADLAPAPARRVEASVPAALEAICSRAMAAEPGARYSSAEELAAEVARYLDGARVLAFREGPGARAARVFARYRTPILLIAAYLLMRSLLLLYGRGR